MTKERRENNADWPSWLHEAWQKEIDEVGSVYPEDFPSSNGKDRLLIRTADGIMTVGWDNYITLNVFGELYPCQVDIFNDAYEKVDNE